MTDRNDVSIIPQPARTLLASIGSRRELNEYADRIGRTLTVALQAGQRRKLAKTEALMIAMPCLAYGLMPGTDVVPLEIDGHFALHYSPSAWQKAGQRQLAREGGGNFWPEYEPITEEGERQRLLVPAGAIAYRCKLYDTPTLRVYIESMKAVAAVPGMDAERLERMVGPRPFVEGVGWYKPNNPRADAMMPPVERAQKRAYKAALKKRFALDFVGESDGDLPSEFTGALAIPANVSPPSNVPDFTDPDIVDASMQAETARREALWSEAQS